MARQAVPSIALSVLIVCFFAVVLYQPEAASPAHRGRRSNAGGGIVRSGSAAGGAGRSSDSRFKAVPQRAADSARSGGSQAARAAGAGGSHVPEPISGSVASGSESFRPPARSRATGTSASSEPRTNPNRRPPGSFTVVIAGETLADISLRVYGTTAQASRLFRANRDALEREDAPLVAGTVLRTPAAGRGIVSEGAGTNPGATRAVAAGKARSDPATSSQAGESGE